MKEGIKLKGIDWADLRIVLANEQNAKVCRAEHYCVLAIVSALANVSGSRGYTGEAKHFTEWFACHRWEVSSVLGKAAFWHYIAISTLARGILRSLSDVFDKRHPVSTDERRTPMGA